MQAEGSGDSRLWAALAHEIRNALGAVEGNAGLLVEGAFGPLAASARLAAGEIGAAARRLAAASDMLALLGGEKPAPEAVDLWEAILAAGRAAVGRDRLSIVEGPPRGLRLTAPRRLATLLASSAVDGLVLGGARRLTLSGAGGDAAWRIGLLADEGGRDLDRTIWPRAVGASVCRRIGLEWLEPVENGIEIRLEAGRVLPLETIDLRASAP